tara:strand:+ start:1248 stop:1436 length:189 start_codon:yes stop_codon:yes gene_type:complete
MDHDKPSLIISVLVDDLLITAENDVVVKQFQREFSDIYQGICALVHFPSCNSPHVVPSFSDF